MQAGLQGLIYKIRSQLVHDFISKFMIEQQNLGLLDVYKGNQVHYYNAFYNLISESFKLETVADIYGPMHLSDGMTKRFCEAAPLCINSFSIIQKLAEYWNDQFISTLKELNVAYWETDIIPAEELIFNHIEKINQNIFKPINTLHVVSQSNRLDFISFVDEYNNGYGIKDFQTKIHAWLANYFCDEPAKVFSLIRNNESTKQYIGSINDLFFWVFNDDTGLDKEAHCKFDAKNYIPLTLSHLTTLDFSSWNIKQSHSLLMQAASQTKKVDDILAFFNNPCTLGQLHKLSDTTRDLFFNQVIEKYVNSHNDAFKKALCISITRYLTNDNPKLASPINMGLLVNTQLFEDLIFQLKDDKENFIKIISYLSLAQKLSCSAAVQKLIHKHQVYDVKVLFTQVAEHHLEHLLANVVVVGVADELLNEHNDIKHGLLLKFAEANRAEGLQHLLSLSNINVNYKQEDGNTALLFAIRNGCENCVKALLDHKDTQVNIKNNHGRTAFHFAADYGHLDYLQALLNKTSAEKNSNWLYQYPSAFRAIVYLQTYFSLNKIPFNEKDNDGWAPLHIAVSNNNFKCMQVLLAEDYIDVNIKTNAGMAALHIAASNNDLNCLQTLLKQDHININAKDNHGMIALHHAAASGNLKILEALLTHNKEQVYKKDNQGYTALHVAANKGYSDCLHSLLTHDRNLVYEQDNSGKIALHLAAEKGSLACIQALLTYGKEQLNIKTKIGWTALNFAAYEGYNDCLKELLNNDIGLLNEQNNPGTIGLCYSAFLGHYECLKLLLACKNIHVNEKCMDGLAALHLAAKYEHLDCLKLLLADGRIDVNNKSGENKMTALHFVARNNNLFCLRQLLAHRSIDVNKKDDNGETALHHAILKNSSDCIVELLKRPDILVNVRDKKGWTPLHHAARYRNKVCVKLLLERDDLLIAGTKIPCLAKLNAAAKNEDWEEIKQLLALTFKLFLQVYENSLKNKNACEYVYTSIVYIEFLIDPDLFCKKLMSCTA